MVGLLAFAVLLAAAVVASIAIGARDLPLGVVWEALRERGGTDEAAGIVHGLRIPRTVLGLMVGAAIGAAGALSQGHTRNPLADPGILGVYLLNITSPMQYTWFGLLGAVVAAGLVFYFASLGRGANPLTLILAGTGLTAVLVAITSAIVLIDTASLDAWRFWQVGAVSGRGWDVIYAAAPFIAAGAVLAIASGRHLNVLALGDDVASALGSRIGVSRTVGVVAITLLVGAATAACGPIVFLGLIAPHIARFVTGPDYRWIVPYSALIGSVVLLWCDVLGRVVARPGELQVGIVVAAVGSPFFIVLIRARNPVSV
nr:iron ABC transporter permease [Gordonia spumicola]